MLFCFNSVLFTKNTYNSVSRKTADEVVLTGGHSDLRGVRRGKGKDFTCAQKYTRLLRNAVTVNSFVFLKIIDMSRKITICYRI